MAELSPALADYSFADELFTIYFVFGRGCAACRAAEPEIDAFLRKHPSVMAVKLDAAGGVVERLGVVVKATPTYILKQGGEIVKATAGVMTSKQIEKWLKGEKVERGERGPREKVKGEQK